ncbi:MAG TPA: DinB family protein [Thermoanaerobaculia bacterium]
MNDEKALREHLVRLLDWDSAHVRFDDAVKDFPVELRGTRPAGAPHSPWELLEHLRIALWDILEFSRDGKHESPEFPAGYWPAAQAPPSEGAWEESAEQYRRDLRALAELTADESADLYAPIPHGSGQTLLREILVAADHNAYHVGQLMMVRRILGA